MTDSIYESLECSVCLDVFQDPRILPCGHTFCLECLQGGQSESSTNRVCSLCRSAWQEPGSRNLDELPKNFVVNSVLSTLQRSKFTHEEATISTPLLPRQSESELKAHFAHSVVHKDFRNQHVDILSVKWNKVLFGSSQSDSCSLCVFELHKDTPKNIGTFSLTSESRRIRLRDATWTREGKIACAATSRRNNHVITGFIHNGMAFSHLCDLNPVLGQTEASLKIHCRFELRSQGRHAFSSDAIFLHANWQGVLEPSKSELELEGSMMMMTCAQDTFWLCLRVIRTASSDDWFDYWTLELLQCVMTYRLCKHTANKQTRDPTLNAKIVCSDTATPIKHDVMHEIDCASLGIDLSARSTLAYYEAVGVFLGDYKNDAVHLFSTDSQYLGKFLSRADGLKGPCSLGVNTADGQLIVGQREGEVRVYDLDLCPEKRLLRRHQLELLPFVGTIKEYVLNNRVAVLCLIVSFILFVISFLFR